MAKLKCFLFVRFLGVILLASACSSGGRPGPVSSQDSAVVKAPSRIDPENPPEVLIHGLKDGDFLEGGTLQFEVEIKRFPLGEGWQEARVILNQSLIKKVTRTQQKIEVSEGFSEGLNRLTVYLSRSFNESIKSTGALKSVYFFYKKKDALRAKKDLGPGIVLVSPTLSYQGEVHSKIPFDFLLTRNSKGQKFRVYYTLDGVTREVSSEGAPYYFYNLAVGSHSLKVELIDRRGRPVRGLFSQVETQFEIR